MEPVEKEEEKRPNFDDYMVFVILGGVVSYLVLFVFILIMMIIEGPSTLYDHFSGEFSIIEFHLFLAMIGTIMAGLPPLLLGVVGGILGGRIKMDWRGAMVGGLVGGVLASIVFLIQMQRTF